MPRTLTDEDCEALAEALLSRLAERLCTPKPPPPPTPPISPPTIVPAQPERIAFSAEEACELLGVSRTTLWRLEIAGLVSAIPGLRKKLYSRATLDRFVAGKASPTWDRPTSRRRPTR